MSRPAPEDFIAQEQRDREMEKASHSSTWLKFHEPRPCPLCKVKPKQFRGEWLCACLLPVVR